MYVSQSPAHALRPLGLLLADGVPTVGWGKTFWCVGVFFFTKTAVTRKRKVERSIQRCEMDCLSKGYNRAIEKKLGPIEKKPRIAKAALHKLPGKSSLRLGVW